MTNKKEWIYMFSRDIFPEDISSNLLVDIHHKLPSEKSVQRMTLLEAYQKLRDPDFKQQDYWFREITIEKVKKIYFVPQQSPYGSILCFKMNGSHTIHYYSFKNSMYGIGNDELFNKIYNWRNKEEERFNGLHRYITGFRRKRPEWEIWERSELLRRPEIIERVAENSVYKDKHEEAIHCRRITQKMYEAVRFKLYSNSYADFLYHDMGQLCKAKFSFPFIWQIRDSGTSLFNMFNDGWAADLLEKMEFYKYVAGCETYHFHYNGKEFLKLTWDEAYVWAKSERDTQLPAKRL